jgi:hypothetical protein
MTTLAQQVLVLTRKYGFAWVIVNQTLGWLTFFAILFILSSTSFDISFILSYFNSSYEVGLVGNWSVAFILNRVLTPLRILLTTLSMPYVSSPINSVVNPIVNRFWPGTALDPIEEDESFPGIEEADKIK